MIPRWLVALLVPVLLCAFVGNVVATMWFDSGSALVSVVIVAMNGLLIATTRTDRAPRPTRSGHPPRHALRPPGEPRPDADLARWLNDDDRAWLREHGDWTDPSVRIVENHGARLTHGETVVPADRDRRAVSGVTDDSGWRTIRYTDGSTEEFTVTGRDRWDGVQRTATAIENTTPRVTARCSTCTANTPHPDELGRCARCATRFDDGAAVVAPNVDDGPFAGHVLVVCPVGEYAAQQRTACRWSMGAPEAVAGQTIAEHLNDHPLTCGAIAPSWMRDQAGRAVEHYRRW